VPMFSKIFNQIGSVAKDVLEAATEGTLRTVAVTETTVAGVKDYCAETEGITELATMLIVAGLITVAGSAAAIAITGGVNNVVNGIVNKLNGA